MEADKRCFLFRFVEPWKRCQLLLDEEALWSVTDQKTADKITRDLLLVTPSTSTIIDGTACVGGNTFSFAKQFQHVFAVELDATRYKYLAHNMRVLGVGDRVSMFQGDITHVLPTLPHHELLFVDLPWGGLAYKNHATVSLFLADGTPLALACRSWSMHVPLIAAKVPTNFDLPSFLRETQDILELIHHNSQLRKMQLLVFRSKCLSQMWMPHHPLPPQPGHRRMLG